MRYSDKTAVFVYSVKMMRLMVNADIFCIICAVDSIHFVAYAGEY